MTDVIIDPKSVTFNDIRNDLIAYNNAQPEAAQWSIFFDSNAGRVLLDYLAGLGAFLKMEAIIARRESFIQFATNRSSIIGHAQGLGYSTYRGRNKVLSITVTPLVSGVWYKYDYVGTVKDRYLVMESDTVVNVGVPVTFNVIVGEVFSETKIAPNGNLNVFRFTKTGVSEDCRIYIGATEIEWSDTVSAMLDGKFSLQSNPFGSVDAKYLNLGSFTNRYISGTSIILYWINLKNVDFVDSDVKLYLELGTLTAISTVSVFADVETDTSVVVNAPLQHETNNAVRGREDQPKIFKTLHPDIIDAKGEDISAAIMRIWLLRNLGYAFTSSEKAIMQDLFEGKRPHGLQPPTIEDADSSAIKLKINLTLKKNSTTIPQDLVDATLLKYKNTLEASIVLSDIEEALEADAGVKIARVSVTASSWVASSYYRLGSYVKKPTDNGKIYRVVKLNTKSNSVEPTWPLVKNDLVTDFEIVWKAVPKTDLAGIGAWSASANYSFGDEVKPSVVNGFSYQCVEVVHHSGLTEPVWPLVVGDEINDGRLVWKVRATEGTLSAWSASTIYRKGDVVKATVGLVTLMFQVVGYLGKVDSVQPVWSTVDNATFTDKEVVWQTQDPLQETVTLAVNQYYVISTELTVV